MKQLAFLKKEERAYGGSLLTKRKGRKGPRPLTTKDSIHLVLRSTKATGKWSFIKHQKRVWSILHKFAKKYGVDIVTKGNAGNHLHLQIRLGNRYAYKPFIRAVTAAIAMAITGASRWNKLEIKFWDRRPFTRIVIGRRGFLTVRDYVRINHIEGQGYSRDFSSAVIQFSTA
jgi:hypothetical protein